MPVSAPRVGIERLNVYCGLARLPVRALIEGRGLDPGRIANLMMEQRSVGLPIEDPVTNAVNACRPILDALTPAEVAGIELLVTATESGVDYSKSVATYVHEHLGLSRHCRLIETKQACYAATGALQLVAGYLASGHSPGAKALVVATDVALFDASARYAEPTAGHGAAALLLSERPDVLAIDPGAFGTYSYETMDSARPAPDRPVVDTDRSLLDYLDCLSGSFGEYRRRVADTEFTGTFDYLALHTPFGGLVRSAHRKLAREWTGATPAEVDADFARRVAPGLVYPRSVGNLCSGSVYLALASLIDAAPYRGPARVGLYSYGSGCSSEFFSGVIDAGSRRVLAPMAIAAHLARRVELTFDEYAALLADNLRCLTPEPDRKLDVSRYRRYLDRVPHGRPLLALSAVERFHRRYEWHAGGAG